MDDWPGLAEDEAQFSRPSPRLYRELSAKFLDTILFQEPWASARTKPRVRLRGAFIAERLDWANAIIRDELWLDECQIEGDLVWHNTRFASLLSLEKSELTGELRGERMPCLLHREASKPLREGYGSCLPLSIALSGPPAMSYAVIPISR